MSPKPTNLSGIGYLCFLPLPSSPTRPQTAQKEADNETWDSRPDNQKNTSKSNKTNKGTHDDHDEEMNDIDGPPAEWFQGIMLFSVGGEGGTVPAGGKQGGRMRQFGVMGVPSKNPPEFHPCCFPTTDPPQFYDVTFVDFTSGVKWKTSNIARRSGRGDYIELSSELGDWVEHDHVHDAPMANDELGAEIASHVPHQHQHHRHHHDHGKDSGGTAKKTNPSQKAKTGSGSAEKDSFRETESWDSDSASEGWTDVSDDELEEEKQEPKEEQPAPDPRAPSLTKFRFEAQEIKVGDEAEKHLKKYFPKIVPDEDILVLVGNVQFQLEA